MKTVRVFFFLLDELVSSPPDPPSRLLSRFSPDFFPSDPWSPSSDSESDMQLLPSMSSSRIPFSDIVCPLGDASDESENRSLGREEL